MKKNILKYSLLITVLSLFTLSADAQVIKAYVAGGFNLAQVDGDQAFGYNKFGANVGVGVDFNIAPFLSLSLEANFNQKGAKQKPFNPDPTGVRTGEYHLNINYAEIPVIVRFTDNTGIFSLGVGASYGRMVNEAREDCHRTDHSNYIVYNKTSEMVTYANFIPQVEANKNFEYYEIVKDWNEKHGSINPNDFNILASLQASIWNGLKFEFRFAYSLKALRTSDYYRANENEIPEGVEVYWDGDRKVFKRKEYNNCLTFRLVYMINESQASKNKALIKSYGGELR